MTATIHDLAPLLSGPGEGRHYWMMDMLATVKAGADDTGGTMTVSEFSAPPGWGVPPHIHRDEDELFYVVEGEVMFSCDGSTRSFRRGGLAWLPAGKPHTFAVTGPGDAKIFNIHTGPRFEPLVADLGEPAVEPRIPDPSNHEPDPAVLVPLFAKHGIDLVPGGEPA